MQAQDAGLFAQDYYSPWDEVRRNTFGRIVDCHSHTFTESTLTQFDYKELEEHQYELTDLWVVADRIRRSALRTYRDRLLSAILRRKDLGIYACRTYVDIGPGIGLEALFIAIEFAKIYKAPNFILQIAAYPTVGLGDKEMVRLLKEACRLPDVSAIGLLPSRDRPKGKVEDPVVPRDMERGFEIAAEFDKAIDMQIDQKNHPKERETYIMADIAAKYRSQGYKRPIAATHCLSMSAWEDKVFILDTLDMMAANDVSMIVCPRATLDNKQTREVMSPTHNSIAPWDLALERGVNVAIGIDNVRDLYMPWCDGDIWKDVSVLLHSTRYRKDPEQIVKILTTNGLNALGIDNDA